MRKPALLALLLVLIGCATAAQLLDEVFPNWLCWLGWHNDERDGSLLRCVNCHKTTNLEE
jgi:hypothetical protein